MPRPVRSAVTLPFVEFGVGCGAAPVALGGVDNGTIRTCADNTKFCVSDDFIFGLNLLVTSVTTHHVCMHATGAVADP